MSVSLSRFSWWYWSNGKEKNPTVSSSDSMKLSSSKKKDANLSSSSSSSSSKKVKRKWQSREERRRVVDKEYDVVLVPSDGEESSYDSDWSIGWMEPHAPDFFQTETNDPDSSFAVLVPCYRNDCKTLKMEETNLPNGYDWVASLQKL